MFASKTFTFSSITNDIWLLLFYNTLLHIPKYKPINEIIIRSHNINITYIYFGRMGDMRFVCIQWISAKMKPVFINSKFV